MESLQIDKKEVLKITGIYMMINIGAGFTSGQEILQFFSGFGWYSFIIGLITFFVMSYAGDSLLDAGWQCKENKKVSVFEHFGGKYIGTAYNFIIPVLLYGSYIIMVAGAGATLEQFFNVPSFIGRLIVCILSILSIFCDFNYIAKYLGYLGKIVAGIIFIVSTIVIIRGLSNVVNVNSFINTYDIKLGSDTFYGAGILYSGSIILASCQFLFDTGRNLNKRINGFYGALGGAIGFVGAILTINLAILLYMDKVYNLPIVTLYFAELISPIFALVLTVLIFVAMYSASTISLWSVVNIIKKKFEFWNKRYMAVVTVVGGLGFVFSSVFSFEALVNIIYPVNGMFGIVLVLLIAIKNKLNTHKKYSE